jgi:hypothetical protein
MPPILIAMHYSLRNHISTRGIQEIYYSLYIITMDIKYIDILLVRWVKMVMGKLEVKRRLVSIYICMSTYDKKMHWKIAHFFPYTQSDIFYGNIYIDEIMSGSPVTKHVVYCERELKTSIVVSILVLPPIGNNRRQLFLIGGSMFFGVKVAPRAKGMLLFDAYTLGCMGPAH